jgi:hypothetical protein
MEDLYHCGLYLSPGKVSSSVPLTRPVPQIQILPSYRTPSAQVDPHICTGQQDLRMEQRQSWSLWPYQLPGTGHRGAAQIPRRFSLHDFKFRGGSSRPTMTCAARDFKHMCNTYSSFVYPALKHLHTPAERRTPRLSPGAENHPPELRSFPSTWFSSIKLSEM